MARKIGGLFGGRRPATSFVAPLLPRPVLSPTRQVVGTPARIICAPVLLPASHVSSWRRDARDNTSLVRSRTKSSRIAAGVVGPPSSPGMAVFKSGSMRSSRVVSSPSARRKLVRPNGPPIVRSRRLPAVLSLCSIAAAPKSPQRHTALFEMFFGHRRVFENVLFPVSHHPTETSLSLVDTF